MKIFDQMIHLGVVVRSLQQRGGTGPSEAEGVPMPVVVWRAAAELLDPTPLPSGWYTPRVLSPARPFAIDLGEIYQFVHDELGMFGDEHDDTSDAQRWETAHFFLQLARIPKLKKCSIQSLGQIGFNLGQLKVMTSAYDQRALSYFVANDLNKIDSYVDADTIYEWENSTAALDALTKLDSLIAEYEKTLFTLRV